MYGVVPKGLLTFLGFFMQCRVKPLLGTSGIYLGTYSLGLFEGLFSDTMGYSLPIILCEMTGTKLLVLKDHIGSTWDDGVPGLQSFNCFNYHSVHTSPTVD